MNPHFSQPLFTLLSFGSGFKVQGSGFRVQGSGFSWRLRRLFLEDGILVSSAFPLRGRCPEGADRALAA